MIRDLVVLTAGALLARLAAAWLVGYPPFTDAAYYTLAAQRLADGHGFTLPVLYSFLEVGGQLPADPSLPVDAFGLHETEEDTEEGHGYALGRLTRADRRSGDQSKHYEPEILR
jgi:hypothetical protein